MYCGLNYRSLAWNQSCLNMHTPYASLILFMRKHFQKFLNFFKEELKNRSVREISDCSRYFFSILKRRYLSYVNNTRMYLKSEQILFNWEILFGDNQGWIVTKLKSSS